MPNYQNHCGLHTICAHIQLSFHDDSMNPPCSCHKTCSKTPISDFGSDKKTADFSTLMSGLLLGIGHDTIRVVCCSHSPSSQASHSAARHLSLISGFPKRVMLQCSLWLFRSWGKSFCLDPAGTRSKTRPRRLRAGFWKARKCPQSPCKIFWAKMRLWAGRRLKD